MKDFCWISVHHYPLSLTLSVSVVSLSSIYIESHVVLLYICFYFYNIREVVLSSFFYYSDSFFWIFFHFFDSFWSSVVVFPSNINDSMMHPYNMLFHSTFFESKLHSIAFSVMSFLQWVQKAAEAVMKEIIKKTEDQSSR